MRALLAVAGLLAAVTASGQVYRWTDSTGKVHYGDKPPDEATARELRIQSYDGPVEVRDWSGVLRGKTMPGTGSGLTMYATSWCGYCKQARAYFARKNIRYTEVDVEKSPEGNQRFKQLGGKGVPLIVMGNKTMRGFSVESFESMAGKR